MTPTEELVRGAGLYLPATALVALGSWARPDRRRLGAALLAAVWSLAVLLPVNTLAGRLGWWRFEASFALVEGMPADLWVGWAVLWGAAPVLAGRARPATWPTVAALVAIDVVAMPMGAPVVVLGDTWLVGEAVAVAVVLVPAALLGRWTVAGIHLGRRVVLQAVGFSVLLAYTLPAVVLAATGGGWDPLADRGRTVLVIAACLLAPAAALALAAVRELYEHGGTPWPFDPPPRLAVSGPYAYVANPMQLGATVLLAGWGLVLGSAALVLAAAVGAAFSAGIAAWHEDTELTDRFGDDWRRYRREVRTWWPRWRPAALGHDTVYVARACDPCREVGGFLAARRPVGLDVVAAELSPVRLTRLTHVRGGRASAGVAGVARSLEHANLGWATVGWVARLPVLQPLVQLVADAVGPDPRPVGGAGGPFGPRRIHQLDEKLQPCSGE